MRIGLGFDIHRIQKFSKGYLLLAGVKVPAPFLVKAHSDGDFIFHAVADALASVLGAGDIGDVFPSGAQETKAMSSRKILDYFMKQTTRRHFRLTSVSVVVAAQEPKLSPYREAIRLSLSRALLLRADQVGLTMKTFENLEPLASKSVACWANCLIEEKSHSKKR